MDDVPPMPPNMKLLGSRERGMVVIGPTTQDAVLDILRQIDKMMRERRTKAKFDKWISEVEHLPESDLFT